MKRDLILIVLLLTSCFVFAQDRSIDFQNSSYKEALEKAKKENKMIFIDCYTSWCGPCKMLAKDVFTVNEVADYFNDKFISLKIDCEKGEGPQIAKMFGVSGYPTLVFLDADGEVLNKIVGASRQPVFLEKVKLGLNPANMLSNKEERYNNGERDKTFLLDLIFSYKGVNDSKKATVVSNTLLSQTDKSELISVEMWDVIKYYYVSTYKSDWWNFLLDNSDKYIELVGEEAFANKVAETMHPYLFGFLYGRKKMKDKAESNQYRELINQYKPNNKSLLHSFITIGESASFDKREGYVKTVLAEIPQMDKSEHYRFFVNAMDYIVEGSTKAQKTKLVKLLKDLQAEQTDYFKPLFDKLIDKAQASLAVK